MIATDSPSTWLGRLLAQRDLLNEQIAAHQARLEQKDAAMVQLLRVMARYDITLDDLRLALALQAADGPQHESGSVDASAAAGETAAAARKAQAPKTAKAVKQKSKKTPSGHKPGKPARAAAVPHAPAASRRVANSKAKDAEAGVPGESQGEHLNPIPTAA